ncbi:PDZ domain-containing protein [Stakelama marina]|uniref:PDZ domain-containing protein n=1 Tax=Stakelama marina TaxID=2826939 RepID=A0A8T4IGD1_9SPHN|nr:PDZ domain-containing protein [Stakelama marina]MBR0554048.1 PDZ domain-containing protein [Stakelama marina]
MIGNRHQSSIERSIIAFLLIAIAIPIVPVSSQTLNHRTEEFSAAKHPSEANNDLTIDKNGLLIANVIVDGSAQKAFLDSGSSVILFDIKLAERLSLSRYGRTTVDTASHTADLEKTSGFDISMAGVQLNGLTGRASDLSTLSSSSGAAFSLILGFTPLKSNSIFLDFSRMRISINAPRPSTQASGRDIVKVYKLDIGNGVPVVQIPVNGKVLRVALDTGMNSDFVVSPSLYSSMVPAGNLQTTLASASVDGTIQISHFSIVPDMNVLGSDLHDIGLQEDANNGLTKKLGVDAIAGLRVVRRFNSYLDFAHHAASFSPSGNRPDPVQKSRSGLQVAYGKNAALVVHVMANSPAERSGWHAGDEICSVNGHPAGEVASSPMLQDWAKQAPGTVVKLGLCNGEAKQLVLQKFY